ncbi:DUF5707 domain-containing protein [Streptomyces sp. NPDC005574]|uniref:DUF5707 domain-containing protein n=1 Tax=Streptomyces sp. NPDC005574 TaxID=3156891 RepID=UPI0033BBF742
MRPGRWPGCRRGSGRGGWWCGRGGSRKNAPRRLRSARPPTASSGVKSVKVLAWPATSSLAKQKLTAKDMAAAESTVCTAAGKHTVHCTYTTTVTPTDAASSPHGAWHIAVLAEANNGTTTPDNNAAGFTVR